MFRGTGRVEEVETLFFNPVLFRISSYINPAIDRWAKEITLAGKIPM
jgi:hypothetical protein